MFSRKIVVSVKMPDEPSKESDSALGVAAIGQAAAVITLGIGTIYAAGCLTLILKLFYLKMPWTSVLGQLPHDFIITTAFNQVMAPAVILSSLLFWVLSSRVWESPKPQRALSKRIIICGAGILGGILLAFASVGYFQLAKNNGFDRPIADDWLIFGWSFSFATLAEVSVLISVFKLRKSQISLAWRKAIIYMVLVVASSVNVANFFATSLLPVVTLCGKSFAPAQIHTPTKDLYPHLIVGSLVGSNSQWIYVGQWDSSIDTGVITGNQITAVPVSSVQLQAIGQSTVCGDIPGS